MALRGLVCATAVLAACTEAGDCISTAMTASDAGAIDLTSPASSAVLEARLVAEGAGLPTQTVDFYLYDGEESEFVGRARTNGEGVARFDLKNRLPDGLALLATADRWEAVFEGDIRHCESSDRADFSLLDR